MKKRERRRDLTMRYGARARRVHLRTIHSDGVIDCLCEVSVWFFAKKKSVGCGCSKKKKGFPKYGRGPCYSMVLRETVIARREWRETCRKWFEALVVEDCEE